MSEPLLKNAAERDLADPTDAESRLATADAWYAVAEADDANRKFFMRARRWYADALDDLTGLDKLHAEKRVADIDRQTEPSDKEIAAAEEPAPIDVWDKAQIRRVSGSQLGFGSDYVSIFGGRSQGRVDDPYSATFAASKGGIVQSVEWEIVRPTPIGKVRVRLRHGPGKGGDGAASAIRLYAFDPLNRKFELLFEFRPGYPYGDSRSIPPIFSKNLSSPAELDFTARFDSVATSRFRAEFVQYGEPTDVVDGIQVVELDAYAE